jgi:hypothetical protein
MIFLRFFLIFLFPILAHADAVIFSGNDVKALKFNLDLFGRSKVMGLNVDPSSGGGVAAPLGSIGMDYLTGEVYFKDSAPDNGWVNVTEAITGTPNTFSGYGSNGVLGPITNWSINTINGAVGVANATTYTAPADSGFVINKIREWALSIVPDVSTNQQQVVGTQFDIHVDRGELNNDFDGSVSGTINVVTHEGSGNMGNVYGSQIQMGMGTSTTTGTVDNAYALDINSTVGNLHTTNNLTLMNVNSSGPGGIGNSTAININDQADVQTNKSGIIYTNSGDAPNFNGLIVNNNTTANGISTLVSLSSSGTDTAFSGVNLQTQNDTTGDYNGYVVNHTGDVSNNSKLLNINSTGDVGNDQVGAFVSLSGDAVTRQVFQGNNSGDVTGGSLNLISLFNSGNVTASTQSINGINLSNQGDADGIYLLNVNSSGDSENVAGLGVSISGTHSNSLTGVSINVDSATVTPSSGNPSGRKTGLSINGGVINSNAAFTTVSSLPQLVDSGNVLFNQFIVNSGDPISGTDILGNNLSSALVADDDHSPSAFGLGWAAVGLVGQLSVASGKTVDTGSFMLAGGSIPSTSTGGTITDFSLYDARGLAPAGGTLVIGNMYGYRYNNVLGFTPTNEWGLHISGASAENYIEKSLAIGTSSQKVTNSSVGLEIGGTTKAFRNSVLTTAQRDALTPLAGMQVYNSTLNAFQIYDGSSWVTPGGVTSLAAVGSSPNANAGTISGTTLTLQPADGTNPGVMTAGTQTLGGAKTWNGNQNLVGALEFDSVLGPATTGDNVTLALPTKVVSILGDSALNSVAGITGPGNARIVIFGNKTGDAVIWRNNSGSASVGNRLNTGGADFTQYDGTTVTFVYDTANAVWILDRGGMANPMTTGGEIIYGGASGLPTSLPNGSSGQYLKSNGGTSAPSWQSFTNPTVQRFTSGSGTYTTPAGVRWIRVTMVGGGGGGGSSGTASWGTTGSATDTTFGSNTARAGNGGGQSGNAAGGTVTIGTATYTIAASTGAYGTGAQYTSTAEAQNSGGVGGSTPLGGGGGGGAYGNAGVSAEPNTGAGGGGGGIAAFVGAYSGTGGGAGGYAQVIINSPAASYSYGVGSGGTGASAGTNGFAGGNGGSGVIIVEEFYQ